MLFPAKEASGV